MCSHTTRMEESVDKKEKVTSTNRRTNKPLMEKRRRQRINDCLNQLKSLVLQAMNKDTTQYSKLEKADILEMTVKHLKVIQRQQMTAAMATDPNVISKYRAGFNECAAEIARYLDNVNGGSPELKGRILGYLANSMMQFPVIPVYQGVMTPSPYHLQRTSPLTPQAAYLGQYGQPPISVIPNSTYSSQVHDFSIHHHSPTDDVVKVPVNPNVETSPSTSSPTRQIPSPYDSDSGLSDTSFSHDENGNYSHYNVNQSSVQSIKSETDAHFAVPRDMRQGVSISRKSVSPKRGISNLNESMSPSKLHKPEVDASEPLNMALNRGQETDSMWRPW